MKLSHKLIFGISSLTVISTVGVLAIASCSNNNPFEDYVTGQSFTINSKKDAGYLMDVAKKRNEAPPMEPGRDSAQLFFKAWACDDTTTLTFNSRKASDCIYWDLAAILSKNYLDNYSGKKRHVSLTIKETNDSYTNNFLIDSSSDSSYSVNTNVDVEIEYLTDKKTSEIIDPITFAYEAVAGNSIPPRNLSIYQSTPTSKKSDLESYNFMKTVWSD